MKNKFYSFINRIKNRLFSNKNDINTLHTNSRIHKSASVSPLAYVNSCLISANVTINDYARLHESVLVGKITIGKNSSLWGPNLDIYASHNSVMIGNFCSIARNVSIQEYNHIYDRCSTYFIFQNIFEEKGSSNDTVSKGDIEIGHDVWIGTHSVILSGAKIGNGAVIAANSVVTSKVPPYAIVAGSPAKIIRYRFSKEIIDRLLELEWWYWSHERIKLNKSLFEGKLTLEKLNTVI